MSFPISGVGLLKSADAHGLVLVVPFGGANSLTNDSAYHPLRYSDEPSLDAANPQKSFEADAAWGPL